MAGRYAVIVAGASQHQVTEGEKLKIDLIAGKKKGDTLTFDKVLLTGGEGGTKVVDNGVDGEGWKGVKVYPLKRRPGDYVKHMGHRQRYTIVQINTISG
jgi:ribosomal protein L21